MSSDLSLDEALRRRESNKDGTYNEVGATFSSEFGKRKKDGSSITAKFEPFKSSLFGIPVFSVYNLAYIDDTPLSPSEQRAEAVLFVRSVKTNPEMYADVIRRTAIYIAAFAKERKIDTIVTTPSSSRLIGMLITEIRRRMFNAQGTIVKSFEQQIRKIDKFDDVMFRKPERMSDDEFERLKERVRKNMQKSGTIEMKRIPAKDRKVIASVFTFNNADGTSMLNELDVIDKNVLIVDDMVTTGTTAASIVNQVKQFNPASVSAITMFKIRKVPT